jgi:hypothetical protein
MCMRVRFSVFVYRYRPCDELITRPRSPTDCPRSRNWWNSALCSKSGSKLPNVGATRKEKKNESTCCTKCGEFFYWSSEYYLLKIETTPRDMASRVLACRVWCSTPLNGQTGFHFLFHHGVHFLNACDSRRLTLPSLQPRGGQIFRW